ncbi:MAG: FAD-dependent oxidoreductase [Acidobacteria bacterium]|nr:FAD-dependent oxidoreductase [Acidobacteriota bacterium]
MNRRNLIAAPFLQLGRKARPLIAGGFVLDAFPLGHKLRDRNPFPAAKQQRKTPLVIVGGGMAGLSAAWWLLKKGMRDFVLLEMESEPGGNSRYGQNEVSAYPWGAHYVPIPNKKSPLVRELFEELGLLVDGELNERHLCHSPQERLFIHGRWQYGLEPEVGLSPKGREQFKRFDELIGQMHQTGKWAIPHAYGQVDAKLEAQPFPDWLKANKFDAPELLWYLDYSTRDDYGCSLNDTSAWAGLHYFAGRDHDDKGPFCWPEGNGFILNHFRQKASSQVQPNSPVYRIERNGKQWRVRTPNCDYDTPSIIWAAPSFLASYIIEGQPKATAFTYSPWVTANLTLDRPPKRSNTAELAWDNVIYGSQSLGYVVATHQSVAMHRDKSVWTWYYAIAEQTPDAARKTLISKPWEHWRDLCLADLTKAHPDLADCVTHIDIFRNGHAMVRPTPGFLASPSRQQYLKPQPGLHFANSDLSGISIFEEAQYRGIEAANHFLTRR